MVRFPATKVRDVVGGTAKAGRMHFELLMLPGYLAAQLGQEQYTSYSLVPSGRVQLTEAEVTAPPQSTRWPQRHNIRLIRVTLLFPAHCHLQTLLTPLLGDMIGKRWSRLSSIYKWHPSPNLPMTSGSSFM